MDKRRHNAAVFFSVNAIFSIHFSSPLADVVAPEEQNC
jgi:hypothetical protein